LSRGRFGAPNHGKRSLHEGVDAILDDAVDLVVRQIAINVPLDGEIKDAPLEGPDELEIAFGKLVISEPGETRLVP
jgi:hypothetical protein